MVNRDQLDADIANNLASIAERQQQLEADPIAMDDFLRAQRADEERLVTKRNAEDLVFETTARPRPAPEPQAAADADVWIDAITEFVCGYTARQLAPLKKEIAELRGQVKLLSELLVKNDRT
jgi:hypothetical protein